jgi:hypothetical protein
MLTAMAHILKRLSAIEERLGMEYVNGEYVKRGQDCEVSADAVVTEVLQRLIAAQQHVEREKGE